MVEEGKHKITYKGRALPLLSRAIKSIKGLIDDGFFELAEGAGESVDYLKVYETPKRETLIGLFRVSKVIEYIVKGQKNEEYLIWSVDSKRMWMAYD